MNVKLISVTPDAEKQVAYCARVSNPKNQDSENISKLLKYCIDHKHWSIFEMAYMTLEINTTRGLAAQILRHRSFTFQEFSQRYADATLLSEEIPLFELRRQDTKNRQNSLEIDYNNDAQRILAYQWEYRLQTVREETQRHYEWAIEMGIAKEQARAILPEGLTPSRMYMNGNMRSWIFYLKQRLDPSTQKEHRQVAQCVLEELRVLAPVTINAFFKDYKG